jgi:hypothetical protein
MFLMQPSPFERQVNAVHRTALAASRNREVVIACNAIVDQNHLASTSKKAFEDSLFATIHRQPTPNTKLSALNFSCRSQDRGHAQPDQ